MMMTRRDWLKGLVATIGLDAVGGGRFLFAAPPGWTAPGGAKLVLGVFSDTHLRTDWMGLRARGGKVVDCEWRDGTVVTSSVRRISKENGQ